jgi:two-component system response regulator YesN
VAELFGIGTSRLSTLFKREFSIGFLDYLHTKRVGEAILLTQNTDESMATIMQRVGYTSRNTFSRAFKRYMGVTPKWYRD